MVKKGVYRSGKVYYWEPIVHVQSKHINNLDWWPEPNQEVEFVIEGNYAYIKSLGKVLSPEEADRYCKHL